MPPSFEDAYIYHITHINNLPKIIASGNLYSDAECLVNAVDCNKIGMNRIKYRRLHEIVVHPHAPRKVGEYVPFYYCPRSVMLYLIYSRHPELEYKGGQEPIVHLRIKLSNVLQWAERTGKQWAGSKSNAGSYMAQFFNSVDELSKLNWENIAKRDWRQSEVKEAKQAEFLVHKDFPWELVEGIATFNEAYHIQLQQILATAAHKPMTKVVNNWYY